MLVWFFTPRGYRIPCKAIQLVRYKGSSQVEVELKVTGLCYRMFGYPKGKVFRANCHLVHDRRSVSLKVNGGFKVIYQTDWFNSGLTIKHEKSKVMED